MVKNYYNRIPQTTKETDIERKRQRNTMRRQTERDRKTERGKYTKKTNRQKGK